jgi:hypothetical protein
VGDHDVVPAQSACKDGAAGHLSADPRSRRRIFEAPPHGFDAAFER